MTTTSKLSSALKKRHSRLRNERDATLGLVTAQKTQLDALERLFRHIKAHPAAGGSPPICNEVTEVIARYVRAEQVNLETTIERLALTNARLRAVIHATKREIHLRDLNKPIVKAPNGRYDIEQVRNVIGEMARDGAFGRLAALQVLNREGEGANSVAALRPDYFDRVYEACQSFINRARAPITSRKRQAVNRTAEKG